jgi:SPX domain protein involved in polyphosphate accumulation
LQDTLRSFNRFELKYLLTHELAEKIQSDIQAYLELDSYGVDGAYAISSLYYDSPDYHFYWEKMEGIKFRRKLRIRTYETEELLTDESMVFVEVKQRLNRVTQKRRAVLSYADALMLCNERKLPKKIDPRDRLVVEEVEAMLHQYDLKPSSITSYFRKAYVGKEYDQGLRVTFDTNLKYRVDDLDLASKQIGKTMLDPNRVVMEIKVNDNMPYWLSELIGKHNVPLIRVSKYSQSLQVAGRVPQSNFLIF